MAVELALRVVRERALRSRADAMARWAAAVGTDRAAALRERAEQFAVAGRLTLNFHPDRFARSGSTVAAGLLRDGSYRSQWATGISNGSRSAILGGDRQRFERALFGFAYEAADADVVERPVYGAFDLLGDPHGGSPRFGSCCLVLAPHVRHRTTLCVGDSHASPHDVGTFDACWSVLAGLAEQAATGSLLERALGVDDLLHSLEGPVVAEAPARRLDGYVEAQVHGGVDLATDVDAVVLDPSFAGTHIERDLAAAAERHGFALCTHGGSELRVADVPIDFRGPTMPAVARRGARQDGVVDARSIGVAAAATPHPPARPDGDPSDSDAQQFKYLWHTLLAHGHDARR
ncbi:MAG: hypothetical protein JWM12_4102 [Ilumatobacteraceae bacterium]|nr:hypothetical protein [Ilumatobacteraceae bacterium]